jgi:HSP20 family protein
MSHEPATNPDARTTTPAATVHSTTDGWTLELEMPGVPRDAVEISCHDDMLTVIGRRPATTEEPAPLHAEIDHSDYQRAFRLDPAIDAAAITASMEQGLLTLVLPKAEAAKPRKVAVA